MGIRHLETYMKKNVENGTYSVNMEHSIAAYNRSHGQNALIVIDLMGFNHLFQPDIEVLSGIRSYQYTQRVRQFFQRLVNCGAKLIFYSDGPVQSDKQEIWFERRDTDYNRHLAVIDELAKNTSVRTLFSKGVEVKSTNINSSLLKTVVKEFGELRVSINVECDLELAAYACSKNAFAIMADDSDFLIYPGTWRYWSIRSIVQEKFTTIAYNKEGLMSHLGLSMAQLPMFATLGGNDIVKYDDVVEFHHRIGNRQKFLNIASYVRNLPLNLTDQNYESIACYVFKHKASWHPYAAKLKASYESYNINSLILVSAENNQFLKKLLDHDYLHQYGVLQKMQFSITTLYTDLRCSKHKGYTQLALNMYSRESGVLLQHQRHTHIELKVYIKLRDNQSYGQILIQPVYPAIHVPDLDQLIFRNEHDNLDPVRKKLLQWILVGDEYLNIESIFQLPKDFISTVAVLCVLVKEKEMSIMEADILLISVYDASFGSDMTDETPPEHLLKDAFLNVFLYLKLYNFLKRAFKSVGLKSFSSDMKFDGFLYHRLHQQWPILDTDIKKEKLNNVQFLRLYSEDSKN